MKCLSVLFVGIALCSSACGSSDSTTTSPTTGGTTKPTFTASLLPSNEVTAVVGAEASGSGNVTVILDTVTNAAGQITSATATFNVNMSGFPPGTNMNIAHIHQGASGCICPVVVSTTLAASDQIATNVGGAVSFVKSGVPISDPAIAQGILNNPGAYYFNVHTTANPQGVARGVLSRVQ